MFNGEVCGYQWTETAAEGAKIPEEKEGTLINIRDKASGSIIIDIARRANSFSEAVKIGQEYGVNNKQVWYIWTQMLKNSVDKRRVTA